MNTKKYQRILFVYNADSGIANGLLDYGKKYLQPDKYDCQLCMVTYGAFGMKSDWKKFTKTLGIPVQFLHRDEFAAQYPDSNTQEFPTMLGLKHDSTQEILISTQNFNEIKSLGDLKNVVTKRNNGSY